MTMTLHVTCGYSRVLNKAERPLEVMSQGSGIFLTEPTLGSKGALPWRLARTATETLKASISVESVGLHSSPVRRPRLVTRVANVSTSRAINIGTKASRWSHSRTSQPKNPIL